MGEYGKTLIQGEITGLRWVRAVYEKRGSQMAGVIGERIAELEASIGMVAGHVDDAEFPALVGHAEKTCPVCEWAASDCSCLCNFCDLPALNDCSCGKTPNASLPPIALKDDAVEVLRYAMAIGDEKPDAAVAPPCRCACGSPARRREDRSIRCDACQAARFAYAFPQGLPALDDGMTFATVRPGGGSAAQAAITNALATYNQATASIRPKDPEFPDECPRCHGPAYIGSGYAPVQCKADCK